MTTAGARWVLGVDCVSSTPGAALWRDGAIVAVKTRTGESVSSAPRPGERLASSVLGLLEETGIAAHELGGVGVTVGPGSFTGIRVGLALVHGLLQGSSVGGSAIGTFAAAREAGRVTGAGAEPAVIVQLRRTDWFVAVAGAEERLLNSADTLEAVADRAVIAIGSPPSGLTPVPLEGGLCAATAALAASALGARGWPRMTTAERVSALAPEYRRVTYVEEARRR